MSAIISDDGLYRYRLEREVFSWQKKVIAYFGVNPSTADAEADDATVRKWTGFAKLYGARRFVVGNVFAYRATDVTELADVADPVGPANHEHLRLIIEEADLLVPCWGSRQKVPKELRVELDKLFFALVKTNKPVYVFGRTASGDPKHPLFLSYNTKLIPWNYRR
jgi:hypothetical protein